MPKYIFKTQKVTGYIFQYSNIVKEVYKRRIPII